MTNYQQLQSVVRAYHASQAKPAGSAQTSPPQEWGLIEPEPATATPAINPPQGRQQSVDSLVAFHATLSGTADSLDRTTTLTAKIDSTLAYRWALIAELKAHPERQGTAWYADRLKQLEASGRSLASMEDALLDEDHKSSADGLPKDLYLATVVRRINAHMVTWATLTGVADQADAVAEITQAPGRAAPRQRAKVA